MLGRFDLAAGLQNGKVTAQIGIPVGERILYGMPDTGLCGEMNTK